MTNIYRHEVEHAAERFFPFVPFCGDLGAILAGIAAWVVRKAPRTYSRRHLAEKRFLAVRRCPILCYQTSKPQGKIGPPSEFQCIAPAVDVEGMLSMIGKRSVQVKGSGLLS